MMTRSELWEDLETEAIDIEDQGMLKRLIEGNMPCPMFIGVQQPGIRRAFVLQIPKERAPIPEVLTLSRGFSFNVQICGDEIQKDNVSLVLTALNASYNEIFESIVDDLYKKLNDLDNTKLIIATFIDRIRLWQRFFEKQSTDGLTEGAQKGLYGELFFLDNHVLKAPPYKWLLSCWKGSEGRQHDFQFGDVSVEVKTSSAKQHQKLHIANEQQLDETQVKKLYLFGLSVSLIQHNQSTLPALIQNIRKKLECEGVSLDYFNNALLVRGYLDSQEVIYSTTGYSIRNSFFYVVKNEFPRIREDEIRRGVGDVEYTISVEACSSYLVQESEFIDDLREISR